MNTATLGFSDGIGWTNSTNVPADFEPVVSAGGNFVIGAASQLATDGLGSYFFLEDGLAEEAAADAFGTFGGGRVGYVSGNGLSANEELLTTRTVGNNSVVYSLDANGSTISASGNLQEYFTGGVRSSAEVQAQADAAASGGLTTDQGGHLVGYRFLPEQGKINLFPQDGNFNTSAFKTIENDYARYINQGYQIDFTHTLGNFDPVSGRPGSLSVQFDVIDAEGNLIDTYADTFLNQSGQIYNRRAF